MKSLLLALQFLTIIPVRVRDIETNKISESMIFFPLVGLLLGLILVSVNKWLHFLNLQQYSINIILVVSLIILTGGIHLDGLADTADAFLSRKNKEEMLKIMRDSQIGAMGALSLISILLLKIALISSFNVFLKIAALLLMCVLSRWAMVWLMFLFPYAREEGKAKIFINGINFRIFLLATVITFICVILVWQLKGILVMGMTAISGYLIGKFIKRKLGGITGDTLGAINEIVEIIVLFSLLIIQRSFYA